MGAKTVEKIMSDHDEQRADVLEELLEENARLTRERDAALSKLKSSDDWLADQFKRIGVSMQVDETHETEPEYLKNDRAEEAEHKLAELAAALEGYYAIHQGGSNSSRADCDCRLCTAFRSGNYSAILAEHDAALVRPLVEALTAFVNMIDAAVEGCTIHPDDAKRAQRSARKALASYRQKGSDETERKRL